MKGAFDFNMRDRACNCIISTLEATKLACLQFSTLEATKLACSKEVLYDTL